MSGAFSAANLDEQDVCTTLQVVTCGVCHMIFAMPQTLYDKTKFSSERGPFWCPAGHRLVWNTNEVQRLQQKLADKDVLLSALKGDIDRERNRHAASRRQLAAAKGVVTRIRNRVANGVCPCCKRHFANLHRHMESEHPKFLEKERACRT